MRKLAERSHVAARDIGVLIQGSDQAISEGQLTVQEAVKALAERLPPAGAAGALAGLDLVLAVLVAWVALSRGPGQAEREAAALAGLARGQIRQSLEWTALVASLLQSLNRSR